MLGCALKRGGAAQGSSEGTSSTGRASVSKTEGWGFKSLVPCEAASPARPAIRVGGGRRHKEAVTHMAGGNAVRSRDDRRTERTGPVLFFRQVVDELRKVVCPTKQQLITYFLVA